MRAVFAAATLAGVSLVLSIYYFPRGLDSYDLNLYFAFSRWVIEGGRLYRDVPSQYPPLANIIFATVRYFGNLVLPGEEGFYSLWILSAWCVYVYAACRIAIGTTILAALAWLAPGPIYFALLRYDIYPAVATLISLFAIRRADYIRGAAWLGVAAALKGYALFLLPAYCVFMVYQRGWAAAIKVAALVAAPIFFSFLATILLAGWEGAASPYKHYAALANGESLYDTINYVFGTPLISKAPWVAHSLQIACALAAAAMRPRSFEDLVNAFLFAILGFISFSIVYSPQYVLWILPLTCFSDSRTILISAILLSWLTHLYFPIGFILGKEHPAIFRAMIVANNLFRLFMMSVVVTNIWPNFRKRSEFRLALGEPIE
jgi:hypothetical protein